MDRRNFLKDVALWSAGIASAVPVLSIGRNAWAASSRPLSVVEGPDYTELVRAVLEPLGGIKAFVKKDARVVIKPNASFDRAPEQGANVHPDVLKAVVMLCLEAGAGRVTVFDRTLAEERRCYVTSGIGPALESISDKRFELARGDDRKFVPVKIDRGIAFTKWQFYKPALDADVYINVPVAKHHGSAKLTLGLKNILGIIGGNRGKIHWSLDQGIADLNTVVTPTLTILDATRIMLRNGPGGGNLEDVEVKNMLIASADTVAVDAWAAKNLFNMDPSELQYIGLSNRAGLGEMDLAKIRVLRS